MRILNQPIGVMQLKQKLLINAFLMLLLVSGCGKSDDAWAVNARALSQVLSAVNESEAEIENSIPFEWDEVYSFVPYLQKEFIYDAIGYKWANIQESTSEDMMQVVFMHQGKVVCHLFGRFEKLGFGVDFGDFEGKDFIKVQSDERARLYFECKEGSRVLRYS